MSFVICPHCGDRVAIVEELVGRRIGCPQCHGKFVMPRPRETEPASDAGSTANCPHCRQLLSIGEIPGNRVVQCPVCGRSSKVNVPSAASCTEPPRPSTPPGLQPPSVSPTADSPRARTEAPKRTAEATGQRVVVTPADLQRPTVSPPADSRTRRTEAPKRKARTVGQRVVIAGLIGAGIAVVPAIPLALVVSQFWPLFGGFIALIAEPFSPASLHTIPTHCIAFGIGGIVLGGAIGCIWRYLTISRT